VSILFASGFESGSYEFSQWTHYWLVSSPVRTGNYCLKSLSINTVTAIIPARSELYIQVCFNTDSVDSSKFFQWYSGSTITGSVKIDSGRVEVYTGNLSTKVITSASGLWVIDRYCCVELHIVVHSSSGLIELCVDGVSQGSFTGNTQLTGSAYIDSVALYAGKLYLHFDDIVICDTLGTVNNSWVGGARIVALQPNQDGHYSQWTPYPAGVSNFTCVDEIPVTESEYVTTDVSGYIDMYGIEDVPSDCDEVLSIGVQNFAKKTSGVTTSMIMNGIRESGTDYFAGLTVLSTSYLAYTDYWDLNPRTSSAWDPSEINNLEIGVKLL